MVVSGGRVLHLDVGNEAVRLGGEFQGWEWHSTPEQLERDNERLALCEQQEWVVVPVWRSDLWGPTADVERLLLDGLVEARRRFGARILHKRRH